MTWPDVIRSVTARIHDVAAQDRELRVLYKEERMVGFENSIVFTVHCAVCCWDSVILGDDEPRCCLHCGAADPELVEVNRIRYNHSFPCPAAR